ncbi:MAG: hypothetical protein N2558_01945 [Patescibacteria group bacterium]|nr:hypothetical protein [Patescibacteria group bacterium]
MCLFVNDRSVFFDDYLDSLNGYFSVVYSYRSWSHIEVSPLGYKVIRFIYEFPGVSLEEVLLKCGLDETKVRDFIDLMISEGIIIEK